MAESTGATGRTTTGRATTRRASARTSAATAGPAPVAIAPAAGSSVVIPATVVATQVATTQPTAPAMPRDYMPILLGLIVVIAAFLSMLFALWLVLVNYKATGATTYLGGIMTAIAGLGGTFVGVAIGQQGTAGANRERANAEARMEEAQMRAERYLANLDPGIARTLVK